MENIYHLISDNIHELTFLVSKYKTIFVISISHKDYAKYKYNLNTLFIQDPKYNNHYSILRQFFNVKEFIVGDYYYCDEKSDIGTYLLPFTNIDTLTLNQMYNVDSNNLKPDLIYLTKLSHLCINHRYVNHYQVKYNYTFLKIFLGFIQSNSLLLQCCINLESMKIELGNNSNFRDICIQYSKLTCLKIHDISGHGKWYDCRPHINLTKQCCENIITLNSNDVKWKNLDCNDFTSMQILKIANTDQHFILNNMINLHKLKLKKNCSH